MTRRYEQVSCLKFLVLLFPLEPRYLWIFYSRPTAIWKSPNASSVKMLEDHLLSAHDRIGTDGAGTCPSAIVAAGNDALPARTPIHDATKHLRQGIGSDHVRVKKDMPRVGGFRSSNAPRRAIQGFEAVLPARARALALPAPGRPATRPGRSRPALNFRQGTKRESKADPALPASCTRVRATPGYGLPILNLPRIRKAFQGATWKSPDGFRSKFLSLALPGYQKISK